MSELNDSALLELAQQVIRAYRKAESRIAEIDREIMRLQIERKTQHELLSQMAPIARAAGVVTEPVKPAPEVASDSGERDGSAARRMVRLTREQRELLDIALESAMVVGQPRSPMQLYRMVLPDLKDEIPNLKRDHVQSWLEKHRDRFRNSQDGTWTRLA